MGVKDKNTSKIKAFYLKNIFELLKLGGYFM